MAGAKSNSQSRAPLSQCRRKLIEIAGFSLLKDFNVSGTQEYCVTSPVFPSSFFQEGMVQYRRDEPARRRRIKRDSARAPKKGIAGLRFRQQQQQQQQQPRPSPAVNAALTPRVTANTTRQLSSSAPAVSSDSVQALGEQLVRELALQDDEEEEEEEPNPRHPPPPQRRLPPAPPPPPPPRQRQ